MAFVWGGIPVQAESDRVLSGNQLHEFCTTDTPVIQMACQSYIVASWHGILAGAFLVLNKVSPEESTSDLNNAVNELLGVCVSESVIPVQIVDVVKKYLVENPANRNFSARMIVYVALAQAFPCK